jgi:hypothetical protein
MSKRNYLLFSAMKNEGPFLVEWIAYHRLIGFDRFVIYSNDCDDQSDALLDILAAAGILIHVRHSPPEHIGAQSNAARIANEANYLEEGDWAIFLDADEFLNIHVGNRTVQALRAALQNADAMLIPWRIFGDGGNARFPGRHISACFTTACSQENIPSIEVKTLFRKSPNVIGFGEHGHHRPILVQDLKPADIDVRDGAGEIARDDGAHHRDWLRGLDSGRNARIRRPELRWNWAQINHYAVRTPEMLALKRYRGRGFTPRNSVEYYRRHTTAYYRRFNCNEVVDNSILAWEHSVTAEMEKLRELPGVAEAETNCLRCAAARVADLRHPSRRIDGLTRILQLGNSI